MDTTPKDSARVRFGGTHRETKDERDPHCRAEDHPWREERRSWLKRYLYAKETPETD